MKNKMKYAGKVGLIALILGAVLFLAGSAALGFDYKKLDTGEYGNKSYTFDEEFSAIRIEVDTSDVSFLRSEDGSCRVECFEDEDDPHIVSVEDGALTISRDRKWHFSNLFGFHFRTETVTVYLPGEYYETLTVDIGTGDISIASGLSFGTATVDQSTGDTSAEGVTFRKLSLSASTGNVSLKEVDTLSLSIDGSTSHVELEQINAGGNVSVDTSTGHVKMSGATCENLNIHTSTGYVELNDVIAEEHMEIETSTGDITLRSCDAYSLKMSVSTGDITGSLRSGKQFSATTSTGDVSVPASSGEGSCVIDTSTGDIKITVP